MIKTKSSDSPTPNTIKQTLTQEDEINVELIVKTMSIKKSILPSHRNKEGRNQGRKRKNTNIPTGNISKLNALIQLGAK